MIFKWFKCTLPIKLTLYTGMKDLAEFKFNVPQLFAHYDEI